MMLLDFLNLETVEANLKSEDKETLLKELLDVLIKNGQIKTEDREEIVKILLERESLGSTGIGNKIGIPHGKTSCVESLTGCVGISKKGIDFDSLDGQLVHIFFLLLVQEDSTGPHLKALAKISRLLRDKFFREKLINATSNEELFNIIKAEDKRKV